MRHNSYNIVYSCYHSVLSGVFKTILYSSHFAFVPSDTLTPVRCDTDAAGIIHIWMRLQSFMLSNAIKANISHPVFLYIPNLQSFDLTNLEDVLTLTIFPPRSNSSFPSCPMYVADGYFSQNNLFVVSISNLVALLLIRDADIFCRVDSDTYAPFGLPIVLSLAASPREMARRVSME